MFHAAAQQQHQHQTGMVYGGGRPSYGSNGYPHQYQQPHGQNFAQPAYNQHYGGYPQQQQQQGQRPGGWGVGSGGPGYNQPGSFPPQGPAGGLSAVEQWSGTGSAGFMTPTPPQNLTWSEPIDLELPHCDGDQFEMKKLIAREYNKSPAAAGDQISSQNIEILSVQPRGANARVSFRVNDGPYPPDPQERGILKWMIVGGIGAYIVSRICAGRRRR